MDILYREVRSWTALGDGGPLLAVPGEDAFDDLGGDAPK